ncbi:OLC1v1010825C1 [Oldenlandia corymbosa var. corymbosa]|uniref:OLC1v1010825C1 n=1 Tax=Oldenlandia corymbosa var. corymbosa TaxID=529605 RepID=A0AAV1DSV3_OLDCO|nr:OLC1v1010825C1 [Oldenlandia corymbosa var. corymbosa]
MDRGKKKGNFLGMTNNKIYMDLKDIIRECALVYLPAKSLMRFKSVCRDWKLQISSPFFAHNQSQCSCAVVGVFCQSSGEPPLLVPFDAKSCGVPDPHLSFLPEPVEIRSSSNGLLCCQSSSSAQKSYYICNPATKQWKKLPKPNADHGSSTAIALLFEPSLLNFIPEYKVVCAFRSNDFEDGTEFEIYNSVDNSWKIAGEILFKRLRPITSTAVCVNNVIHWSLGAGHVLSYDPVKDRSKCFFQPHHHGYHSDCNGLLGNVNGELASVRSNGNSIYLSVMEDAHTNAMPMDYYGYGAQRLNKKNVSDYVVSVAHQKVVFVCGEGVVFQVGDKLSLLSLRDHTTKELMNLVGGSEKRSFVPYVNSLVSI